MLTDVYASPAVFGAISLLLGSVVLFSSRERTWLRVMAFCALLTALPMLWQTSLGLPRPTDLDAGKPSGTVVSYVVDEPTLICVWLAPDDSNLPRADVFSVQTRKAPRFQKVRMEPGGSGAFGGPADRPGRSSDGATDGSEFNPAP